LEETNPSRGGVLVAVTEGGGIVGFASFGPSRNGDTDPRVPGEVCAIYADPSAWGTGAGRALMGGAVTELARLGYADAILWVLATNDRARRLYAIAGWEEDGAHKTDGSRGFDIAEVQLPQDAPPLRLTRPCSADTPRRPPARGPPGSLLLRPRVARTYCPLLPAGATRPGRGSWRSGGRHRWPSWG
jgi:Acetyltransferase (GNAT) family